MARFSIVLVSAFWGGGVVWEGVEGRRWLSVLRKLATLMSTEMPSGFNFRLFDR